MKRLSDYNPKMNDILTRDNFLGLAQGYDKQGIFQDKHGKFWVTVLGRNSQMDLDDDKLYGFQVPDGYGTCTQCKNCPAK